MPRPRVPGPARHGTRPQRPKVGDPVPWAARTALPAAQRWLLLAAVATAFALTGALAPGWLPAAAVAAWALAIGAAERPGYLLLDAAAIGGATAVAVLIGGSPVPLSLVAALVLLGAIVTGQALRRQRSGALEAVGATDRADAVLIDLRERARAHGGLPPLPPGWLLDADLRPADGDPFSGDVLVVERRTPGRLDLVLADVSGKGHVAAGRALLLTGALGALLAEVPPETFLAAANRYVLGRHGGDDGFATAVQLSVDLDTGAFTLSGAGHPPAAHLRAGSGRWDLLGGGGPPLGVVPDARYPVRRGRLAPGDTLLLYTDGMVEDRRYDLSRGIDRLTGLAEPLLTRRTPTPATDVAAAVRAGTGDDRTLVVLRHLP